MKSNHFGGLVKALRRESRIRSVNMELETQDQLDKKLKLPLGTIGRIERGERVNLSSKLLSKLADIFQLTTRERRQFFLAAHDFDHSELVGQSATQVDGIMEALSESILNLMAPVFVVDWHGDVILCNGCFIKLMNQDEKSMQSAQFNLLAGLFENSSRQSVRKEIWHERAIRTIQIVRALSLLHRDTPYFSKLLTRLNKLYPEFRILWQEAYSAEDDTSDLKVYEHFHTTSGVIRFLNILSSIYTNEGELHLVIYMPVDAKTFNFFEGLSKQMAHEFFKHPTWPRNKTA